MNKRATCALGLWMVSCGAMAAGPTIGADNASSFIGKDATVCGKIDSAKYNENSDGQPTFLHMGGKFPVHKFAIRIMGENRSKFTTPPEDNLGRMVCVSGRVGRAAGNRAEMEVQDPSELQLL